MSSQIIYTLVSSNRCSHTDSVPNISFDLAAWHAFAKMRMRSDSFLKMFGDHSSTLGRTLRHFDNNTYEKSQTTEPPREKAARTRVAKQQISRKCYNCACLIIYPITTIPSLSNTFMPLAQSAFTPSSASTRSSTPPPRPSLSDGRPYALSHIGQ